MLPKTVEDLEAEIARLRTKISPLEDKEFTRVLAERMAKVDWTKYRQKFRGGEHIVITPRQVGEECFGAAPNMPMATNIGRSLQALLWERSARCGVLIFVKTIEEYEHDHARAG